MCASNLHCKKTVILVAVSLKSTVLVTTEGPKANRNIMGRDSVVCRRGPASAKQDGGLARQLQPCMPCMWLAHTRRGRGVLNLLGFTVHCLSVAALLGLKFY